jgi:hypothetical protein
VASNLKAMLRLSSPYYSETGSILRNLVETCVDFFWVASYVESDLNKGNRLAENFFLFGKAKFVEHSSLDATIAKTDPFLRDIKIPADDPKLIETCKQELTGHTFKDSWRFDPMIFSNEKETKWKNRSKIAAEFAEKAVNLKGAPYYANLLILSSYSHFDPVQIIYISNELVNLLFDRSINIAIGFVFDMIMYSYKRKNWTPPETLVLLKHEFIWFSK